MEGSRPAGGTQKKDTLTDVFGVLPGTRRSK